MILKLAMLVTVFFGVCVYSGYAFYGGGNWSSSIALMMLILFVQEIRIGRLESTVDEWEEDEDDDDDGGSDDEEDEPDDDPPLMKKMRMDGPKVKQKDLEDV